jgi:6-phosphogluconolactonase
MKWKIGGQAVLAASVCTGLSLGLSSCGQSNTVDYVYVASAEAAPGRLYAFKADSESGALTPLKDVFYSSGGNNPVSVATTPVLSGGKQYLYVINHDDNTLVQFAVGVDGKLYPGNTYNTPGTEPSALAVNDAGTFLYVVDTYQPGFTPDNPGPGALIVYPINSDGSLGTPAVQNGQNYLALDTAPTAVGVLSTATGFPTNNISGTGNYIYITETVTTNANSNCGSGRVRGFSSDSSGTLTEVPGSPFCAGVAPTAVAGHPQSTFLYVTDGSLNQLISYQIAQDGSLTPLVGGPVSSGGVAPSALTLVSEVGGVFLYLTNKTTGNIEGFTVANGSGIPATLGSYGTDAQPQCLIVEPGLSRFVYTADYAGSGSTGYSMNPNSGVLTGTENSPYFGGGRNSCVTAVRHGNHPVNTTPPITAG